MLIQIKDLGCYEDAPAIFASFECIIIILILFIHAHDSCDFRWMEIFSQMSFSFSPQGGDDIREKK